MPWVGLPVGFMDVIGLMTLGLVSVIIPIFLVIFIARRRSMSRSDAMAKLGPVIHSIAIVHSLSTFIGTILLVVWWHGAAWTQLGFVPVAPEWYWKSLLALFATYLIIGAAIVAISYAHKFFAGTKKDSDEKAVEKSLPKLDDFSMLGMLGYAAAVPFAEEVVFRGVLYGWLRQDMSPTASIMISSVIFGLAHGVSLNGIMTFFLGIGLAILYEHSGSLLPCIVVHMVNNAIALTLLGLIRQKQLSPGA